MSICEWMNKHFEYRCNRVLFIHKEKNRLDLVAYILNPAIWRQSLRETSIKYFLSYFQSEWNEKEKTVKRALFRNMGGRKPEMGGVRNESGGVGVIKIHNTHLWELQNESLNFVCLTQKEAVWERGTQQLDTDDIARQSNKVEGWKKVTGCW